VQGQKDKAIADFKKVVTLTNDPYAIKLLHELGVK
jgi:hypothetical protein